MARIKVEGKEYKVLDSLGYVHDVGGYVKEVETPDGPRKAVKRVTEWHFWTAAARLGRR